MADKNDVMFYVKAFDLGLGLAPGFPVVKKMIRDLNSALPKKVREAIASESKGDELENWVKSVKEGNSTFQDYKDGLNKWIKLVITKLENEPEDSEVFESKRGRDVSAIEITLFGKTATLPEQVLTLIEGSKLAELLAVGVGEERWDQVYPVMSGLQTAIQKFKDQAPEAVKPKRASKNTANSGGEAPETVEEVTPEAAA